MRHVIEKLGKYYLMSKLQTGERAIYVNLMIANDASQVAKECEYCKFMGLLLYFPLWRLFLRTSPVLPPQNPVPHCHFRPRSF